MGQELLKQNQGKNKKIKRQKDKSLLLFKNSQEKSFTFFFLLLFF